jgi:glucose/mannose-6-phosphate isomerase
MNLDDTQNFSQIDPQNMLGFIDGLPAQLEQAWALGHTHPLPEWEGIERVVVAGMGGSAIGADLVASYIEKFARVPLTVYRDYGLPAWASGPNTLVVASSHSGNTEETLSTYRAAQNQGCRSLVITTGGQMAELARGAGVPVWTFEHHGMPRSAVGFSFSLLLALFERLGFIPNQNQEIRSAVTAMRLQQDNIGAGIPIVKNMAKRMAGQLMGRMVVIFGSEILAPVARRWKGQISELAKAWAQFEILPEADHNTLAGTQLPEEMISRTIAMFLRAPSYHPRNLLRSELTREMMMVEGFNTDFIDARGDTPLAHQWTCLHFGDYTAYYLAISYDMDPTPISALEMLKEGLKNQP